MSVEANMEINEVYSVCYRMLTRMEYVVTRPLKELFELAKRPSIGQTVTSSP